ncbi:MAG: methylmalonyl Co-A mutase-associated GTPase MeaB [Chloroflexota bacterium]|nr:methylmalonyl Co-A mutase-associated GTPase MeaB [Chloroflexota bacterium]
MELVERMLSGEQQALARLITLVEREAPEVPEIMRLIHPRVGRGFAIGITGPPGAGKSTLVDRLTALYRKQGQTVGIIAVDPTSPFSGGAVLGDRIRMQQHYLDPGVFIRSMATRGSRGGLPLTTKSVIKLMDAFGKDVILVETVGVGQTELDIIDASDTVLVVLVPEAGDTIQTMKAGLTEIADIFAVNKADRDGAEYLVTELKTMLLMSNKRSAWQVPVIPTQGINNTGIDELLQQIEKHHRFLEESGQLNRRRREQRRGEFFHTIEQRVREQLTRLIEHDGQLASFVEKVEQGEVDPYSAASQVLQDKTLLESWLSGARK